MNREVGLGQISSVARALIPYPILPPSLISRMVSVAVKHHERRRTTVAQSG